MSWAALPVGPACMGKAVGEAGRPLMLCGARLYFPAEIRIFTDNGLICLSITSVYLSGGR